MKRLVITGLPCPPKAWESLLGKPKGQRILSLFDILSHTDSSDLRVMARYVAAEIEKFRPTSIVAHDFGVPLTLLSLLRLQKRGKVPRVKVTLFNGAFRKVDVLRANQPFRVQVMSVRRAIREVEANGGQVDLRLKGFLPRIRAIYRAIILYSFAEKIQTWLGLNDLVSFTGGKAPLKTPIQIIASSNDPYIPFDSVEQVTRDFSVKRLVKVDYGHFPYSVEPERILPFIEEFEAIPVPTKD